MRLPSGEPIYEEFPGWTESTFGLTEWDELPESARQYLSRLSEVAGAPIAPRFDGAGSRADNSARQSLCGLIQCV